MDGRRPPELRKLQCQVGVFKQADGSSFLEQGNTKVLASVYGPHDVSTQAAIHFYLSVHNVRGVTSIACKISAVHTLC